MTKAIETHTTQDDPIFAAIEAHKKANHAFASAIEAPDGSDPDPKVEKKFGAAEHKARWKLCLTAPATMAGLAAMIRYLTDVQTGTYSAGRPDLAFDDNDIWAFLLSARNLLDDAEGLPRLETTIMRGGVT